MNLATSLEAQRSRQQTNGAIKTWEDVERYERAIAAARPTMLIETGTYAGYSAWWFRERVPLVVSIDINENVAPGFRRPGLIFLTGDSISSDVFTLVRRLASNERVMVSLDSDHSAEHVLKEMNAYAPLVSIDSYLVVEDGIVRWLPDNAGYVGSPLDAIEAFVYTRDDFAIDTELEELWPQTQFPSGWLRRVRRAA